VIERSYYSNATLFREKTSDAPVLVSLERSERRRLTIEVAKTHPGARYASTISAKYGC